MNNIVKLVEEDIKLKDEEYKKKPRSGLWNPSFFGRCYRAQYYNRKDEPKSNPPDLKSLMIFRLGSIIHEDIQKLLPKESVEVEITDWNIHGFADYVEDDAVWDFKSSGSWMYKRIKKVAEDLYDGVYTPSHHRSMKNKIDISYILQVICYSILLNKPYGKILFINKENYNCTLIELRVSDWKGILEEELNVLKKYWDEDKLPPSLPRAFNGKECNYCNWFDTCKKEQMNYVKRS